MLNTFSLFQFLFLSFFHERLAPKYRLVDQLGFFLLFVKDVVTVTSHNAVSPYSLSLANLVLCPPPTRTSQMGEITGWLCYERSENRCGNRLSFDSPIGLVLNAPVASQRKKKLRWMDDSKSRFKMVWRFHVGHLATKILISSRSSWHSCFVSIIVALPLWFSFRAKFQTVCSITRFFSDSSFSWIYYLICWWLSINWFFFVCEINRKRNWINAKGKGFAKRLKCSKVFNIPILFDSTITGKWPWPNVNTSSSSPSLWRPAHSKRWLIYFCRPDFIILFFYRYLLFNLVFSWRLERNESFVSWNIFNLFLLCSFSIDTGI